MPIHNWPRPRQVIPSNPSTSTTGAQPQLVSPTPSSSSPSSTPAATSTLPVSTSTTSSAGSTPSSSSSSSSSSTSESRASVAASTSDASSASSTLTSTSSSSTNTAASSTSTTSSPPSNVRTTTSEGRVVTVTSTQTTSDSSTAATPSASSSHAGSTGFFQNKAAVAGVFAVVGLIALVIIVALIINFVRRRRAEKFDREIAEAAAEAAAVRAPAFLDDEDDSYGASYSGAGPYGKYSDGSHGTFNQPPMAESYGMRELGPGPGEIYDLNVYNAAAGAAGIGVARARSRRDGTFAAGLQEGTSPYPAFVGPQFPDSRNTSRSPPPPDFRGGGGTDFDITDPAGITSAAIRRGSSRQSFQPSLGKNRSLNALGGSEGHPSNQSQSYQAFDVPTALQPSAQRKPSIGQRIGTAVGNQEGPSGPETLPNPFAGASERGDIPEEREEEESEDEEEEPRRVLRVANE